MTKLDDLRYLRKIPQARGRHAWLFEPPQSAIDAGVVSRKVFQDGRVARKEVPKLIERVDRWRMGEVPSLMLSEEITVSQLVASYLDTKHFNSLAPSSQQSYKNVFNTICRTKYGNTSVGELKIRELNGQSCQRIYDQWAHRSNNIPTLFGVLMSYAISQDILTHNPMAKVKKVTKEKRSVVWTRDQVVTFLDYCFENFKYRNVGLICLMAYEWMQRPTDMRLLKWSSVDLDNSVVKIKQTKRGAEVTLPIPENLQEMLEQQKEDFGFQEWVVPHLRASDKAWRPYRKTQLASIVNEVLDKTGLPRELRLGDLRKTGITEAIEAGVPITNLMSLTGHKNLSSLSPYVKPTIEAAKKTMEMRRNR